MKIYFMLDKGLYYTSNLYKLIAFEILFEDTLKAFLKRVLGKKRLVTAKDIYKINNYLSKKECYKHILMISEQEALKSGLKIYKGWFIDNKIENAFFLNKKISEISRLGALHSIKGYLNAYKEKHLSFRRYWFKKVEKQGVVTDFDIKQMNDFLVKKFNIHTTKLISEQEALKSGLKIKE